jgi:hypothetical protein
MPERKARHAAKGPLNIFVIHGSGVPGDDGAP